MNQELWLNLDRSRPHERIVWLISPKSSKKLKKDDLIDFDPDFEDAGSFTEILGITVILTNAPASNCVSELLQSLLRVTYISDASKKDKIWSQMDKKGKKYKKRGRRRRDEVADADEEEIESWLHRPVGALLPRNSDEAFNFFFLS